MNEEYLKSDLRDRMRWLVYIRTKSLKLRYTDVAPCRKFVNFITSEIGLYKSL